MRNLPQKRHKKHSENTWPFWVLPLVKEPPGEGTFDAVTLKLNTMDYGLNVNVSPSNFQDQYNFVVSNTLSGEAGLMEFNDATNENGVLTFYVVLNIEGTNPLYIQPFPSDGAKDVVVKLVQGGIGGKVLASISTPIPPYVKPA